MPTIRLRKKNLLIRADYWVFGLVVVAVALFLRLGFWQIERAGEKTKIQQMYQAALQSPVTAVNGLLPMPESINYHPVRLSGRYLSSRQFLLENRYRVQANGARQLGYEVLTPFQTLAGEVVLVNRGWLPADIDRSKTPVVDVVDHKQQLVGIIVTPQQHFRLAAMDSDLNWPRRILYVDLEQIMQRLSKTLYPAVLMLSQQQATALRVDWEPVTVRPVKHYGYAVQWFLMALVLLLLFAFSTIKRIKK